MTEPVRADLQMFNEKRFAIAVSFPGEDRTFVHAIVNELAGELGQERIFYDEWCEHELCGVDGDLKLRRYYREQSQLIVPFFSRDYPKPWCKVEWSAIRSVLLDARQEDRVIPVALDDTPIDGWEKTDFAIRKKDRDHTAIAKIILKAYYYRMKKPSIPSVRLIELPEENLPEASESDAEAERGRRRFGGLGKLKVQVTKVLEAEPTRRFILRKNRLSESLSAEELTNQIFSITPKIRGNDENHTPMCLLRRCISPPALPSNDRDVIFRDLGRLAALLAPVSLVADNSPEIQAVVLKTANHADIFSKQPTVGAALVAAHLGIEVDLEHKEVVEEKGNWIYTGISLDTYGKLHSGSLLPMTGIEERDIVAMAAEGLQKLLGSVNAKVEYVRASLRDLARQGTFVCLWFNRKVISSDLEKLKEAFPDLYVLVSCAEHDSDINAQVFTHLDKIQKFLKGFQ